MTRDTCPSRQTLGNHLLGRLTDADSDVIDAHLATCDKCQHMSSGVDDSDDELIRVLRQPSVAERYVTEPEREEAIRRSESIGTKRSNESTQGRQTKAKTIRDYEFVRKLGEGGMGQVFLARHNRLGKEVALKTLPPSLIRNKTAVSRFMREMTAIGKLEHPNIVRALDAGQEDGQFFLVMEYVRGKSVADYIRRKGTLSVAQAISCILMAARGLEYAHNNGVIHRDVKPSNLLVDRAGQVKLSDLGLARYSSPIYDDNDDDPLTYSKDLIGTVDYLPPEQAANPHQADQRADVYALGCTLHTLLVGVPPYAGGTMEKLLAHRDSEIPSLRIPRKDVPKELDTIFRRMLAKDPDDRQVSMTELIEELESCWKLCSSETRLSVFLQNLAEQDDFADGSQTNPASSSDPLSIKVNPRRRYRTKEMLISLIVALISFGVVVGVFIAVQRWLLNPT